MTNREICPVCSHNIPIDRKHVKEEIKRCFDCGAVTNYNPKKSKESFYPPEEEGDNFNFNFNFNFLILILKVCSNEFALYLNC